MFHILIENDFIKIQSLILTRRFKYCYSKSAHYAELNKGRSLNPNSAKFISLVMNITEDQAKVWIRNNNSSPFYKENFSSDKEYVLSQSRDLRWHIEKYGEEIGAKKYNELIKKQNYSRSLAGYIEKYGDEGSKKT